eukprot:gnl/MRDRNA2_/MRDRNA2_98779_c0_seq1.p1 gnl/MRDRNA2_/MRDRNA2_98779_c0~~gnl/MRDRNA2_/MRDRNA2_98779_c0_seq1.p1  ORF type:complete len:436 (+),score=85.23 gnl/MRDRNA2_/MRDRNA2_98779_c0_seq1:100-1407(+)
MGCNVSSAVDKPVKRDFHATYTLNEELGKGAFGAVYKAHLRNACDTSDKKKTFAVKVLSKKSKDGPGASEVQKEFRNETNMMMLCKSDHVVDLFDTFEDRVFCYTIMEHCQENILDAFCGKEDVNETQLSKVFAGMAKGIEHCHKMGVVHRDVKPQNFLLAAGTKITDPDCVVKLCDFGMAIMMPLKSKGLYEVCGTCPFMAPEMLQKENGYDYKVDVWALGAAAHLMLFGAFPYNPVRPCAVEMKALIRSGREEIPFKASSGLEQPSMEAVDFVKRLLDRNPSSRPTSTEVLAMPYLQPHMVSFIRERSRIHSLHSNIVKAANEAKLANEMMRKHISHESLQKFEEELQKLADVHGVCRRSPSERTMTVPSIKSGSLSLSISAHDLSGMVEQFLEEQQDPIQSRSDKRHSTEPLIVKSSCNYSDVSTAPSDGSF